MRINKRAEVAKLTPDKMDFKTKGITRDKGSSNSTSEYLSEETQNNNSKRHMNRYVHCNIIHNGQDIEST